MLQEQENILNYVKKLRRSPNQFNNFYEADSEIISIGNSKIAITTDVIVDEIDKGIFTDYYEIGWVSIMASMSDLVACGASAIGLLTILELPINLKEEEIKLIFKGIEDACIANNTFVLGGDTNFSDRLRVGSVGIGKIDNEKPLSRKGLAANEMVFVSNRLGNGNANAVKKLMLKEDDRGTLPNVNNQIVELLNAYATSAIDTSDGLFAALSTLGELNQVNFELKVNWESLLEKEAVELAHKVNLPAWYFLAGPLGEYEIVFSVKKSHLGAFLKASEKMNFTPIEIGETIRMEGETCTIKKLNQIIPVTKITNEVSEGGSDLTTILTNLSLYKINH